MIPCMDRWSTQLGCLCWLEAPLFEGRRGEEGGVETDGAEQTSQNNYLQYYMLTSSCCNSAVRWSSSDPPCLDANGRPGKVWKKWGRVPGIYVRLYIKLKIENTNKYNGKVEVIVELVGIAFASLGSTVFSSTETLSESTEPSSDRKVKLWSMGSGSFEAVFAL